MASKNTQPERMLVEAVASADLPADGSRIVVGVSGGKDSVVLLDVLATMAPARGWSLVVAHLDHGLREASAADAEFVAAMADAYRLDSVIRRVDVAAMAARLGEGLEHAAREARMTFFVEAAREFGATAVALAHHADDQAETVLFRAARGTSLRGLAGMAPVRELAEGVSLYRPMLAARRAWIEAYAKRCALGWREDETNRDAAIRRNAIRHEMLPRLERQVAPGAAEALVRLANQAREASDYLAAQAEALSADAVALQRPGRVVVDVKCLADAVAIVRRELYRMLLADAGMGLRKLTDRHLREIDALLGMRRGGVNLPDGYCARREETMLVLSAPEA